MIFFEIPPPFPEDKIYFFGYIDPNPDFAERRM